MSQYESLMAKVSEQMPAKRWQHTLGVIESSIRLAKRFGADPDKAEQAAILHDYAKYWPLDRQRHALEQEGSALALELLSYDPPLWHAEVAAIVAEHELGITDREVLAAIRYHTSGREEMTTLEKVVCLADYIEPGRQYPGVEDIREAAEHSLEQGLLTGFNHTIRHLLTQGKLIYPETIRARNGLIIQLQANKEGTA